MEERNGIIEKYQVSLPPCTFGRIHGTIPLTVGATCVHRCRNSTHFTGRRKNSLHRRSSRCALVEWWSCRPVELQAPDSVDT